MGRPSKTYRFVRAVRAAGLLLGLALAASGCYTTRNLPAGVHSVAVPLFENKTYYDDYSRGWETTVTESVRQAFLENGRLAVTDRQGADLILEGKVLKVERAMLRQDRYGESAETQIRITAEVSLYHAKDAKYLFKARVVNNQDSRPNSGLYNLRRGEAEDVGRKQALEDLGRNIARQVLDFW